MTLNKAETSRMSGSYPRMNRELFGVFGDERAFTQYRSTDDFDRILTGPRLTVGVRDDGLPLPGRTSVFETSRGCVAIWGEAITPDGVSRGAGEWLYEAIEADGRAAFDRLNGSYVAVADTERLSAILPDLLRSRECFYTDAPPHRIFGTDAASVARQIEEPTLDTIGLNQHLYFGVVFEDRTLLEELRRVEFDTSLGPEGAVPLDRIKYEPKAQSEDEHAKELASRLKNAVRRRTDYPHPKGILSSAGFDSRLILATVPDLDVSYTIGTPTMPEMITARKLANQYDIQHQLLPVTQSYLTTSDEIVQYTNGIRESIHIHHRGNEHRLEADTIYHGLLLDTVLRDIYLPRRTIELFGHPLPLRGLVSNPDPLEHMKDRLGIFSRGDPLLAPHPNRKMSETDFLEGTMATVIGDCRQQTDSIHNAMSMLGLKVTQALPFQTHLADNFYDSLVAADTDLVDWHLTTPPHLRNSRTYQSALEYVDEDLLAHRPPDRPHRSHTLNQIEGFLRRNTPYVESPGTPWPDRDEIYDTFELDDRLFPNSPEVHPLPPRIKLRINDAFSWLEFGTDRSYSARDLLRLE